MSDAPEDTRSIGRIVREAREAKGLTREELVAKARNVKLLNLVTLEEDMDPRPLAQDLFFLSRVLGLDYQNLLVRAGHLPEKPLGH
ncbi:MAG TPA: hypothetical protein VKA84_18385 [Gemmatimonadaceae bacterium]|nr:hypothetical protein [Gemmatimonadaceae bacterium]